MQPLVVVLAILGLALAAAGWAWLQKWTGRYEGEEYPGTEDVGRCGRCGTTCRRK